MKLTTLVYGCYDEMRITEYYDGNTAIMLRNGDGEEEPISVNLPNAIHFPSDKPTFWADTNNCSEAIDQLERNGVIARGTAEFRSGFCTYPEYEVLGQ